MSPSSSSSSSSSSSDSVEDDPGSPSASHPSSSFAAPDSPGAAHQSSDESTSSDVVLVDLPAQESRSPPGDSDGGILVNIDGSMQDNAESAREDTFEDASDQLGIARSASLGDSMAVIEFGDSSAPTDDRIKLEETIAECRKYKEEREVFGREIAALRSQLQSAADGLLRRMEQGGGEEEIAVSSPTPLHSMIGDCSKLVSHLNNYLDEQLNLEAAIRELRAVLFAKDQEILDLNEKVLESEMSHGAVVSYMGSLPEVWSENVTEKISKMEEDNSQMAEQLGLMRQSLEAANAEASRMRTEVEQTENRLAATREKLSMAVTKGKSLVQHRDTLKQSLVERSAELDHCRQELQHTSEALHSTRATVEGLESELERRLLELQEKSAAMVSVEASAGELQRSLAEKNSELERCLLELDQKNDALVTTETIAEELKKSLAKRMPFF